MISVFSLWLPILLSAVSVFVVSSLIHMVLKYHASDFKKVPEEDAVRKALGKFNIPPDDYAIPRAGSMQEMGSDEFIEKQKEGPNAFFTIIPNGQYSMGMSLLQWFLYSIVVSLFVAYIVGRVLEHGTEYIRLFQIVSCTAFMGYYLALLQGSIWYKRKWSSTLKSMFDGLLYGLVTAGIFGWLWPA